MRTIRQLDSKYRYLDKAVAVPDPALFPRSEDEFLYLMSTQDVEEEDRSVLLALFAAGAFILWREWDNVFSSSTTIMRYQEIQQQWRRTTKANAEYHRRLAQQLAAGAITLEAFSSLMATSITDAAASSAIATWGINWQSNGILKAIHDDYVAQELNWLSRFVAGLLDGSILFDGNLMRRAAMYGLSAYVLFTSLQELWATTSGYTHEQNVLGIAEHCDGCIAETGKGIVPIGSLAPIGTRDCLSNCRCRILYYRLNPLTGEYEQ